MPRDRRLGDVVGFGELARGQVAAREQPLDDGETCRVGKRGKDLLDRQGRSYVR
jgi:hypothetical protein